MLALALLALAQPPAVRADATADRTACALSESVRVTLSLEGPAPLRVEVPKMLLTADADSAWRVRPDGEARVTALPNNRERWEQRLRLDPYVEGAPLVASFAPVKANGQAVEFPAVRVTVEKKVSANTAVLPVTPPEDPPAPPPVPRANPRPYVAAGVALVCFALAFVVWRRARRVPAVPPLEWARAELARVRPEDGPPAVARVAEVLRAFVERHFGAPATKLTTNELLAAAAQQGWPVEQADALRGLLDECDRAKFAGDLPDDDGRRGLVRRAGDWLNDVGRAAGPR